MHWQCSRRKEEEEAVKRQVPILLARGDWGCSVAKPYLTLCDCMDCSTPGYPGPSLSPGVVSDSCLGNVDH